MWNIRTPVATSAVLTTVAPTTPEPVETSSSLSSSMLSCVFTFVARLNPFTVSDERVAYIVEASEESITTTTAVEAIDETSSDSGEESSESSTTTTSTVVSKVDESDASTEAEEVDVGTAWALNQQTANLFALDQFKESYCADDDTCSTRSEWGSVSSTSSSSVKQRSSCSSPKRSREDDEESSSSPDASDSNADEIEQQGRTAKRQRSSTPESFIVGGFMQARFARRTHTDVISPIVRPSKRLREVEIEVEVDLEDNEDKGDVAQEQEQEQRAPAGNKRFVPTSDAKRSRLSPTYTPRVQSRTRAASPTSPSPPSRKRVVDPAAKDVASASTKPAAVANIIIRAHATAPGRRPLPPRMPFPGQTCSRSTPMSISNSISTSSSVSTITSKAPSDLGFSLDKHFVERLERDPEYFKLFVRALNEMYGVGAGAAMD